MGFDVIINTNLIGQKQDPQSKKKKQWKIAYCFIKGSKTCQKNWKGPVSTHRKIKGLASWTTRGKIVQTCFLVSESKLFSSKQVFVLTT